MEVGEGLAVTQQHKNEDVVGNGTVVVDQTLISGFVVLYYIYGIM